MDTTQAAKPATVERRSDRELVVTRHFAAPVRLVFDAWSKAELFQRWWTPKSFGITMLFCEMDVRTGGSYRLVMKHPSMPEPMAFFGRYTEVVPLHRIVWTNEESGDAGQITTVTFAERDGATVVELHELYPTKDALDEAMSNGSTCGYDETFAQLDEVLA